VALSKVFHNTAILLRSIASRLCGGLAPKQINKGENKMTKYMVHFFCDECSEVHPIHIIITLNDGPAKKESINNLYAGKELPTSVASLINNKTTCPNTGKLTSQADNNQVFLVPMPD
jgi:hypothetical protein